MERMRVNVYAFLYMNVGYGIFRSDNKGQRKYKPIRKHIFLRWKKINKIEYYFNSKDYLPLKWGV